MNRSKVERNKQILNKYMEGATLTEISRDYGFSVERARQIVNTFNVDMPRAVSTKRNNKVKEMYDSGLSVEEITEKMGFHSSRHTTDILRLFGLKFPMPNKYAEKLPGWIARYKAGESAHSISNGSKAIQRAIRIEARKQGIKPVWSRHAVDRDFRKKAIIEGRAKGLSWGDIGMIVAKHEGKGNISKERAQRIIYTHNRIYDIV